jgi:signal transduction histidine kinase
VRLKLPLLLALVGLLAYGVGGTLASYTAERALERAILERLELQARASAFLLHERLDALAQRADDFASDGYVRARMDALERGAPDVDAEVLRAELRAHLVENKLPLATEFQGLSLVDVNDEVVLAVARDGVDLPETGPAPSPGTFTAHSNDEPPLLPIATPLRDLSGARRLGRLVAWVRPGTVLLSALRAERAARGAALDLALVDRAQRSLRVPAAWLAAGAPGPNTEVVEHGIGLVLERAGQAPANDSILARTFPIEQTGLAVEVRLDTRAELEEVAGLRSRFLAVGGLLVALTCLVLYFPVRFLTRPLRLLTEAAGRVRDGELAVRVPITSTDEFGQLGEAFNRMAASIEERTERLEGAAADLRAQRRAASEERDRLAAVIGSMRDGLVVLDGQGTPLLANAAARPLLELLEADSRAFVDPHHRCAEHLELGRDCAECLVGGQAAQRSCVIDFRGCTYEVHTTLLPPNALGLPGRVLVGRDITERLTQDEREIHHERLSVLGEVAAVVAHELNNPLAAIHMYNQMLEAALPDGSALREHVAVIDRNARTCTRTVRELLDYATGAIPEVGALDVHATLEDAAAFVRPLRERAGVSLELDLADAAPEVTGDEIQVRQVFVNLLMNAVQALAPGGAILVRTRSADAHVVITISDDGPGIPAELQERVFQPFFTTKARGAGTGLGLSTAQRIAELHGGGIELVESRPGRTTFEVRMRRRAEVAA